VEHRYRLDAEGDKLVETRVTSARSPEVLYIDDSLGLHKVSRVPARATTVA
jgi:hypothetical protein